MHNIPLRVKNLIIKTQASSIIDLMEILNIKIIKAPDMPFRIHGFWRRVLKRKCIFYDENLEEWQQNAVICHELGHIVLHPNYRLYCMEGRTWYCDTIKENEADKFAAVLYSQFSDIDQGVIEQFLKTGWL